jgi:nitrous oxidase accessory protein
MKVRWLHSLVLLLFSTIAVQGELLTVGKNGYQTITSALAAAKDGDTIRVEGGTYSGNLLVDKAVRLEGVDKPVIKGVGKGSVITVTAAGSVIVGFRIEGGGHDLQAEDAGILLRSNGNTIEDNELSDILFGIYLFHSSNNSIRRNVIVGRRELESGERGGGLHLWNSPDNTLEDNTISYARDGMYIQSSPRNTIRRNRVSNLRYGLHYMSSDDNRFEDNVFFDNIAGAAIMYSQRIELRRNAFVHNRGFSSFGLLFQDCRQCVAEENLILDNAVGLFLEASKDSLFRRNTIAENDVAMQIFSSSQQNTFALNNFINNLSPLQVVGASSSADWRSAEGGNYWSDYDGYDMDADGVGDVPHRIHNAFEYLEGNYPRLRIYLNSPAAEAVVAAEKAFPILKGSNEFDRGPLMRPIATAVSFATERTGRVAKWVLLAFSSAMLAISGFVFRRGFSR